MTIPQHPTLAWPPIEIEVVGYRLVDAFEAAALKAITTFCEHHPNEVAAYPIGLFRQSILATQSGFSGPPTLVTYLEMWLMRLSRR